MLSDLLKDSIKLEALLFGGDCEGIVFPLFEDLHPADVHIEPAFIEHSPEARPVLLLDEVAVDVAVEEMLAWNKVPAIELAVAFDRIMVWDPLAILDPPIESTYLVHQQDLDRVREASKEGIRLYLGNSLGPEFELDSSGAAEVAFVR